MARKRKPKRSVLEAGIPILTRQRMCLGKGIFWSRFEAEAKIYQIVRSKGPAMRTYQCPNCGQWHLTRLGVS
jgi:hypothetical protein